MSKPALAPASSSYLVPTSLGSEAIISMIGNDDEDCWGEIASGRASSSHSSRVLHRAANISFEQYARFDTLHEGALDRLDAPMYTGNSSGQILIAFTRHHESDLFNHLLELVLARELLDALHEILVAVPVSGNKLPN